jgi:hypothetical protein
MLFSRESRSQARSSKLRGHRDDVTECRMTSGAPENGDRRPTERQSFSFSFQGPSCNLLKKRPFSVLPVASRRRRSDGRRAPIRQQQGERGGDLDPVLVVRVCLSVRLSVCFCPSFLNSGEKNQRFLCLLANLSNIY